VTTSNTSTFSHTTFEGQTDVVVPKTRSCTGYGSSKRRGLRDPNGSPYHCHAKLPLHRVFDLHKLRRSTSIKSPFLQLMTLCLLVRRLSTSLDRVLDLGIQSHASASHDQISPKIYIYQVRANHKSQAIDGNIRVLRGGAPIWVSR
jgi:hypothetical protein